MYGVICVKNHATSGPSEGLAAEFRTKCDRTVFPDAINRRSLSTIMNTSNILLAFRSRSFDPKGPHSFCKRITQAGPKHDDHQHSAKVKKELNDRSCPLKRQKRSSDTCVIRTHAPEGIALAGQRVNHSAKVPWLLYLIN